MSVYQFTSHVMLTSLSIYTIINETTYTLLGIIVEARTCMYCAELVAEIL